MFFNKGKRILKDYTWTKRFIGWLILTIYLLAVNFISPIRIWQWLVILFHTFAIVIWYGSKVKIESLYIGFRYFVFFFLLSLSLQFRHSGINYEVLMNSMSYLLLISFTTWTLPRVKLGLDVVKPVGSIKLSLAMILLLYNGLMYLVNPSQYISHIISSFAISSGLILLFSIYSHKNIVHFYLVTYAVHQVLIEFLLYDDFSTYEYAIVLLIYIIFLFIQKNTKPKKEVDDY